MMNPRGEKFVSRLLMGGCATTLVGGVLLAMVLAHGVGEMAASQGKDVGGIVTASFLFLVVVGGVAMMLVGLVSGIKYSAGGDANAMRHLSDVTVASRFAVNDIGEMIFSEFEYDAPGGKLYVQLRFPDGHMEEVRTAWGVFAQCGEGMRGAAMVKGSWLASFAPMITKSEPLRNPEI
ncbi:MAG: hypothetical protein ACYC96_04060 [Fimbriimonadaceae bacterium]